MSAQRIQGLLAVGIYFQFPLFYGLLYCRQHKILPSTSGKPFNTKLYELIFATCGKQPGNVLQHGTQPHATRCVLLKWRNHMYQVRQCCRLCVALIESRLKTEKRDIFRITSYIKQENWLQNLRSLCKMNWKGSKPKITLFWFKKVTFEVKLIYLEYS